MILFKNTNIRGQRDSGRSREVIDRVNKGLGEWEQVLRVLWKEDVQAYSDMKCVKRGCRRQGTREEEPGKEGELMEEDEEDKDGWDEGDLDLGTEEQERHQGMGQTREVKSWIWTMSKFDTVDGTDKGDKLLRAEWAHSRGQLHQAREEVLLLREEMRHTAVYIKWKT
ncbi:hypothetical protein BT96DRAFT_995263 [Gymnopus androsaceus JB14]|uniref:Uncharacterized protein n=1 Tax=Gymnopus androsaceus JB14 TaxID=1447944 RepID=A0A6A4HK54_9AGAR|nr:hypothetical protein BT96DRAFT_995263 [Gymnopus androsaceus JB14]